VADEHRPAAESFDHRREVGEVVVETEPVETPTPLAAAVPRQVDSVAVV